MAIETNNLSSIQAYQKSASIEGANQSNRGLSQAEQANQSKSADKISPQATQETIRTERQASLVAHLFGDKNSASSDSLKLTYQAAMEKINEILSAEFGIEKGGTPPISNEALKAQGGMDYWSPENTAKRIVDGSTAFLASFQAANPKLEGEALIDRFLEVVGGGIAKGFEEAKGLLGGLDVLKGDIASNIESTFKLVQEGLQNFRSQYLGTLETVVAPETGKVKTDA